MYNEQDVLDILFPRLTGIVEDITWNYEIICVDDGSEDETGDRLLAWHRRNPRIKVLFLSRNFGKEMALTAGLHHSAGDAVIPIDADLQDPPELMAGMVERWLAGADMVVAVRSDRSADTLTKRVTAAAFYRLIGRLSHFHIPHNAGDFRLMDRKVVEAFARLTETNRFNKGLFAWLGFKQAVLTFSRQKREAGSGKWHYIKLFNHALDGILSFSTMPLKIWSYLGLFVSVGALLYGIFLILRTVFYGIDVPGYASLAVMSLFFNGLIFVGLGILGEYVGRIFLETKRRPLYIVDKRVGFDP